MGRLIDVDALKADYGMKDDCADCDKELRGKSRKCEFDRIYSKMDFCGWLDDAPTVDVVPARHGRWKMVEGELAFWDMCSACGRKIVHRTPYYDFCPNCGARMDGEQT